ncbi:hypothetical protein ACFT5B_14720 [Luteimicrobium sp. NPDC057192]|uniref:hypothetical protein n=1 Tax=Luteimicrobium sp. NPDC057192 TaxID=3346042 RepID=UPI003632F225
MTRKAWRVVGLALGGLVVLAGVFGLGVRWSSDHGPDVALPPVDAPPGQVVQAYLDAVNADDERVLRAVTTPAMFDGVREAWLDRGFVGLGPRSGFGDPTIVKVLSGDDVAEITGRDPDLVADVVVRFEARGHDDTIGPGAVTWSIELGRDTPTSRWLVYDQGEG